jgi:hypothetical protein
VPVARARCSALRKAKPIAGRSARSRRTFTCRRRGAGAAPRCRRARPGIARPTSRSGRLAADTGRGWRARRRCRPPARAGAAVGRWRRSSGCRRAAPRAGPRGRRRFSGSAPGRRCPRCEACGETGRVFPAGGLRTGGADARQRPAPGRPVTLRGANLSAEAPGNRRSVRPWQTAGRSRRRSRSGGSGLVRRAGG